MEFNTKVIFRKPQPYTGAVTTPVYLTSTFEQKTPGETYAGYEYSRGPNPTRQTVEDALARIENGTRGFAFASGMAAIETVLKLLEPGDEIITCKNLYGGTYRLFADLIKKHGIKIKFSNCDKIDVLEDLITNRTKLIWLETPTNPLLKLVDIKAIARLTKEKNIILSVDNTFASPYLQNPLEMGADIAVHSATKYLGGHSDVIAGLIAVKDKNLEERISYYQNACGAVLGPFDSYLILRGIRTLSVRVQRHCENALKVARFLEDNASIGKVFYPGLESHPQHDLAKRQMRGFGGVLSFKFASGKKEEALEFLDNLDIFILADSLGGVESLANYSATMTHADVPEKERRKLGISDDLVRLSIGIEDVSDLIEDLKQALEGKTHQPSERNPVLEY